MLLKLTFLLRSACHLNHPTLPISAQELLDALITLEELHNATKLLQKGKSPGPGGIPLEFYI